MNIIPIQPLAIPDSSIVAQSITLVPHDRLPILEVFHGIEGEGLDIGEPRILMRIGGCRVSCTGCDTPHSWGLKSSTVYSLPEVKGRVFHLANITGSKTVAITGGEPMHYPVQLVEVAQFLRLEGIRTWLETSGLILDAAVFHEFDFLSMDVKTPSSGPAAFTPDGVKTFKQFFQHNTFKDGQFKFIVTDENDARWILNNFNDWCADGTPFGKPVVLTPACGAKSTPAMVRNRVALCQEMFKGFDVRVIAQQHALLGMD